MGMHPREGWIEPGVRRPGLEAAIPRRCRWSRGAGRTRRVCSGPAARARRRLAGGTSPIPLPRPDHPVKWPIFAANKAIASNLQPETGATLQLYNWVAYINQQVVDNFAKKYNCKVSDHDLQHDDRSPGEAPDRRDPVRRLLPDRRRARPACRIAELVQPLNHSYIPNISQAWSEFTNPFYDLGWQYTVPYTIYTTGIAWRKDHVPGSPADMANPWAFPWQAQYKGKVAVLDDYREGLSLGLMKNGVFDLNTTDPHADHRRQAEPRGPEDPDQRADRQQRLHVRPGRQDLDPSRLVRRHGGCRVLPAEGHSDRGGRLLVPRRTARVRSATTRWPSRSRARTRSSPTCS